MYLTKKKTICLYKKKKLNIPDELNTWPDNKLIKSDSSTKIKDPLLASSWMWDIGGIGPSKSVLLHKAGITPKNIMSKKSFSQLPTITQLYLIHKPKKQIHRDKVPIIVNEFLPKKIKKLIVGSYRRCKTHVGDIDILILNPEIIKTHLALLTQMKLWIPISTGNSKISGIYLPAKSKIDLWLVYNPKQLPFMKLYATGSYMSNIIMRTHAKRLGMKLTQYELINLKTGKPYPNLKTELDIYNKLKMTYKQPHER
jgi:DNA polymerase/3'-5' exonuclease PolX